MTSKHFLWKSFIISTLLVLSFMLCNIIVDDYALFNIHHQHKCIVYLDSQERLDKYLFSFRYIPNNFEGVLIGPSLSDNLNTKLIHRFKIYNASILGGNATELKSIITNVLEHENKPRFIVVCMDPYITKDSGMKSTYMTSHDYWRAFGSMDLLGRYIAKGLVRLKLSKETFNEYGYKNCNRDQSVANIKALVKDTQHEEIYIDPVAFDDLKDIIQSAHDLGVKVFAFYYPLPYEQYLHNKNNYLSYQDKMSTAFASEDVIWDFNDAAHCEFGKDYGNYSDGHHLSYKGANKLTGMIERKLIDSLSPR